MNKIRRKEIETLIAKLEELMRDAECIKDEEDEARDNMPESMWESERYQVSEEASDNLDSAISSLEEVIDYLTEAMN